jgi:hypothetical protein
MTTWRWFNDEGYYDGAGHYVHSRTALPVRLARHGGAYVEAHPFRFWLVMVAVVWLTGFVVTGTPWGGVRAVAYSLGDGLRPMGEAP